MINLFKKLKEKKLEQEKAEYIYKLCVEEKVIIDHPEDKTWSMNGAFLNILESNLTKTNNFNVIIADSVMAYCHTRTHDEMGVICGFVANYILTRFFSAYPEEKNKGKMTGEKLINIISKIGREK